MQVRRFMDSPFESWNDVRYGSRTILVDHARTILVDHARTVLADQTRTVLTDQQRGVQTEPYERGESGCGRAESGATCGSGQNAHVHGRGRRGSFCGKLLG